MRVKVLTLLSTEQQLKHELIKLISSVTTVTVCLFYYHTYSVNGLFVMNGTMTGSMFWRDEPQLPVSDSL